MPRAAVRVVDEPCRHLGREPEQIRSLRPGRQDPQAVLPGPRLNQLIGGLHHRLVQQFADTGQFVEPAPHAADGSLPRQTRQRLIDGRAPAEIQEVPGRNCRPLHRAESRKHLVGNRMGDVHARLLSGK